MAQQIHEFLLLNIENVESKGLRIILWVLVVKSLATVG